MVPAIELVPNTAGSAELGRFPPALYRVEVYLIHHPLLPATVPLIGSNPTSIGKVPSFPLLLPTELQIDESYPGPKRQLCSSRCDIDPMT